MTVETFQFQAEINQLMSLIINAFYSNKEIFLRELISNSSDALDKIRHESLTDSSALENEQDLYIHIKINKDNNTLTITDTGIGMTKDDLVNNLGTIARSGTKTFMEKIREGSGDISLIGQFGVGFYSAYLVADDVTVTTKHNSSDVAYIWKSKAGGSFTIEECDNFELKRGTSIELKIKDDQNEYLNESRILDIVRIHSNYISYPISYWKTVTETINDDVSTDGEIMEESEGVTENTETSESNKEEITKTHEEWCQINNQKPIWTYKPEDITQEKYEEFYKSLTNDWDTCAKYTHFHIEGQLEFTGLLFIPKRAPFDLFDKKDKQNNIKLYVRRVFITEDCKDLVPEYLNFVKGLVDSEDLPLNVSREILQQNKIMKVIKKNIIKKCIDMFEDISVSSDEDYKKFYENYNKNIKLGIIEDSQNRGKLVDLLRFDSIADEFISLENYCKSMQDEQNTIYYITGESSNTVKNSPFLEGFTKRNYNVLFLTDPIDEYAVQQIKEYSYKDENGETHVYKLVNITKEGININNDDTFDEESFIKTCNYIQECIKDEDNSVEKVTLSSRIVDSPCVIVTNEYGWSANMERIMKAQALGNNQSMMFMSGKKTLEINKDHKLIKEIHSRVNFKNTKDIERGTKDIIVLMYQSALVACGFTLNNPQGFNRRIVKIIESGLDINDFDEDIEKQIEETVTQAIEEDNMEEVD